MYLVLRKKLNLMHFLRLDKTEKVVLKVTCIVIIEKTGCGRTRDPHFYKVDENAVLNAY